MIKTWVRSFNRRRKVAKFSEAIPALEQWYESPFARALLEEETRVLDDELSCLFGYHLMQLSIHRNIELYRNSRIHHCFSLSPLPSEGEPRSGALSDFEELPLADESVDVTLLHHVLEFSTNPHQILKEASRVTIANGYIIIFGFNPLSPMGVIKPFARFLTGNAIWRRNSLGRSRVVDWLKFLDFSIQYNHSGFYNLPINNKSYLQRSRKMNGILQRKKVPFGNFYCLVARKDVSRMTLIRPKWEKETLLSGVKISKRAVSAKSAARLSLIRNPASTKRSNPMKNS